MFSMPLTINGRRVGLTAPLARYHDWLKIAHLIISDRPDVLYVGMRNTWVDTRIPIVINGYYFDAAVNTHCQAYSCVDEPVISHNGSFSPSWSYPDDCKASTLLHAFSLLGISPRELFKGALPEVATKRHRNSDTFEFDQKLWPIARRSSRIFDWSKAAQFIKEHSPTTARATLLHDAALNGSSLIYDYGAPVISRSSWNARNLSSVKDIPVILLDDRNFYECWSFSEETVEFSMTWPEHALHQLVPVAAPD